MHQKRLIKKTHRSVSKPLNTIIVSTEKKYAVKKEKNMDYVHSMKAL